MWSWASFNDLTLCVLSALGMFLMTQWHIGLCQALIWEKCCCYSANRMCWQYHWYSMSSITPMVLWSQEHFLCGNWSPFSYITSWGDRSLCSGCQNQIFPVFHGLEAVSCPSLCLQYEKESTLSLGNAWIMQTLMKVEWIILYTPWYHPSILPILSWKDRCLWNNPIFPVSTRYSPRSWDRSSSGEWWPIHSKGV